MTDLYKDMTAEYLLERMLDRYRLEFDKREGSLTWDEFANVAIELRHLYIQLDWIWKQMFGDTADRESLIRLAADRDIYPRPASPAVLLAEFDVPISEGERLNLGDLNYIVTDVQADADTGFRYLLTCETPGAIGNVSYGTLIPMRTIPLLTRAEVISVEVPGEDPEDTEDFRERYYETLRSNRYGFNIAEYKEQINNIPGVGGVRVYPADPDPGHVRLVVIGADWLPASETLVEQVQTMIDPEPHQKGMGRAPIGHRVSVETAGTSTMDIQMTVVMANEVEATRVQAEIRAALEQYMLELRTNFASSHDPTATAQTAMIVRQAHVETRVLGVDGVVDVTDTRINQEDGNVLPAPDTLPVLGEVVYNA